MYKVGNPFALQCFQNAKEALWANRDLTTYFEMNRPEQAQFVSSEWKREFNITFVDRDAETSDYAVFEAEEDYLCFKLKWDYHV